MSHRGFDFTFVEIGIVMKSLFTLFAAVVFVVQVSSFASAGLVVDLLDFSTPGQGATHSDTVTLPTPPQVGGTSPNDWILTYNGTLLNTDSTLNEFVTVAGSKMRVQDWGGAGTVTGSSWTATSNGTMDINGAAAAIAAGPAFNAAGEGLTWFYSINGGGPITSGLLGNGTAVNGTDLSHSFSGIGVSLGDLVSYGFSVNVDGARDGAEISSMEIDFTAIPEPGTIAMFGIAVMGLGFRRRR